MLIYNINKTNEQINNISSLTDITVKENNQSFYWIAINNNILDKNELFSLQSYFNLHALAIEDVFHADKQIVKYENYHENQFIVLKTIKLINNSIVIKSVIIFVSKSLIISIYNKDCNMLIQKYVKNLYQYDAYSILYYIFDDVVDDIYEIIQFIQNKSALLNNQVFQLSNKISDNILEDLYKIKHNITRIRHEVVPMKSVIDSIMTYVNKLYLSEFQEKNVNNDILLHFQDIKSHIKSLILILDSIEHSLNDMLTLCLAKISIQQNIDMRRISALACLFAIPTLVAGIYGMNFEHMPELHWTFGYPILIILLIIILYIVYLQFKRNNWL